MVIASQKIFVGLLLTVLSTNLYAQTTRQKDSLRKVFMKVKVDTNTVWALMDYGKIMSDESVDSAKFYYTKSFNLSKKLNYPKGIAQYYFNVIYLTGTRQANHQEALRLAKDFELFARKENNDKFLSGAYFSLALTYQNSDRIDSAIYYYQQTLPLLEKIKSLDKLSVIYGNLSRIYMGEKMNNIALEYLEKAQSINVRKKDTAAIIINYINKSTLYYQMKNKLGEEKCNQEALKLAILSNNKYLQMSIFTNIAAMFEDRKSYDSSIYYNQKAYQLAKQYGSSIKSINPLIGLVACYLKKKNFREANKYLKSINENPDISRISLEQRLLITEQKINALKGIGQYEQASHIFEEYLVLKDSTTNIATQERVLEFNNKLKKAESEKVILAKEVQINKQKLWIYLLLVATVALLLLGFLFYRYQRKKQQAKSQKIKLLEQENEFVAVKSTLEGQLNERVRISKEIHDDLGSSLTSISLLTEVLKTKVDSKTVPEVAKISTTSARMVDSLNEIVWALNVHNDTLNSLVAFIRKYVRDFLQDTSIKLVFNEDVNQDFSLQGNVRRSIYLVVKEAINNVVKHAEAQQVSLNIRTDNNKLIIIIEDDGRGINEAKKSTFGNGLRNMKQRIENIGGTFTMYQTNGTVVSIEYNF